MEYVPSILFHTDMLKCFQKELNQEMWLRFNIKWNNGVCFIDSIPHCHTEKAFKRGKNQEMWLRYYIEDKVRVCIIDSIPHCFLKHFRMAVWNTFDDTYSNFVLYIVMKPHFLIYVCLFSTHIHYGSVEYYRC